MRCLIIIIALLGILSCSKPSADVRLSKVYVGEDGKKFTFTQVEVKYQPSAREYQAEAKLLGIHGTIVLEILLDDKGVPIKTIVLSGPSELRTSAEAFAMQWRFLPALIDGKPYPAKYKLTLPFIQN